MSRVPATIVDDHNEALDFYYRLIARKKIPFSGLCLVHFDSHPDLAAPEAIPVKEFKDRHLLLDKITISDWILPAVYSGHFANVIWMKPSWAGQISCGQHEITLGIDEDGFLKTSSSLPYFTSDLCYRKVLQNPVTFLLHVIEVSHNIKDDEAIFSILQKIVGDQQWCLDIDMDFYSTQNPFKSMLGKTFHAIHELFRFKEESSLQKTLQQRKVQLSCLKSLCNGEKMSVESEPYFNELKSKIPDIYTVISEAKDSVISDEYITDLFYIGQQTELPHHLSSIDEIDVLLKKTTCLLKLLSKPVAITMARSEYDEYSSPATLDVVQRKLLEIMKELYNIQVKSPD